MSEMEWISVEKSLPDKKKDVLLGWTDDESLEIGCYDGEFWRKDWEILILTPPTHWMELPEPPKRGG